MNGDRHHNSAISKWLIRQTTKRRARMGMHDPDSDEYRPYEPNEATPIPQPVIQPGDAEPEGVAGAPGFSVDKDIINDHGDFHFVAGHADGPAQDSTVADLPAENGATLDDHGDDGFIPHDGESSEEAHARFHEERGDEADGHTHG